MLYYTGIGSRETPSHILPIMVHTGYLMAKVGFTLRSGAADGADTAFEFGCDEATGLKQIFLPWSGFNGRRPIKSIVYAGVGDNALALAKAHHPAWERCSAGARSLLARNGYQVLGPRLDTPSALIICWTKDGKGEGGTGQALRIARAHNIYIMDLGSDFGLSQALAHVERLEEQLG